MQTVFEDKSLCNKAIVAVEKAIHHKDMGGTSTYEPEKKQASPRQEIVEETPSKV
jgi:hypothetical protein